MDPKTGEILEFDNEKELEAAKKIRELVELKGMPKKSCKKCHGQGHVGFDIINQVYIICSCVKKEKK